MTRDTGYSVGALVRCRSNGARFVIVAMSDTAIRYRGWSGDQVLTPRDFAIRFEPIAADSWGSAVLRAGAL